MIKGLEMPKNCLGCSTKCDPENRKCNIDGHIFEETFAVVTNQRDKDCPLVETDVEAVKDQLPCGERMGFPSTFDEFAKNYGFRDKEEIYTNGSELIPVFRVKQWLEHISTTKNDLEVLDKIKAEIMQLNYDVVYREEVLQIIDKYREEIGIELRHNPSELVELLEEQYKSGEISPIVISESLITLFRMLGEKNRPIEEEKRIVESEGQE